MPTVTCLTSKLKTADKPLRNIEMYRMHHKHQTVFEMK